MFNKFKMLVAILVLTLFGNINTSNANLVGNTVIHGGNTKTCQMTMAKIPLQLR